MPTRLFAPFPLKVGRAASALAACCVLQSPPAVAAEPAQTSPEPARQLIAEAKCAVCHAKKVGGDGSAIYTRKDRRVTSKAKLLPQVARCNNELNLGLFPDDEAAIAAYLNRAYYRFTD